MTKGANGAIGVHLQHVKPSALRIANNINPENGALRERFMGTLTKSDDPRIIADRTDVAAHRFVV